MSDLEMFADIACPFTHVGLRRFAALREARGTTAPRLRVRAWPLELVNGRPFDGPTVAPKVAALRAGPSTDGDAVDRDVQVRGCRRVQQPAQDQSAAAPSR
jgi:hypothetical protein